MAWEKRKRGKYYYRTRRTDGRYVRQYVGRGKVANLAAETDELRRTAHKLGAKECQEQAKCLAEVDKSLEKLCRLSDLLVRASLLAAGYHQHNRGEWRRRRNGRQNQR